MAKAKQKESARTIARRLERKRRKTELHPSRRRDGWEPLGKGFKGFFVEYSSVFDGAPCVAIFGCVDNPDGAANPSQNDKTGDFIQACFIRRDVPPDIALKTSDYRSVCHDCIHGADFQGTCYVQVPRSILTMYKTFHRGRYTRLDLENPFHVDALRTKPFRFGTYGEVTSISSSFWDRFWKAVAPSDWTGYTHQWKRSEMLPFRAFLMASVDSPDELREAWRMGWRTFRVRGIGEPILRGEFECPASELAGKRLQCDSCLACKGLGQRDRKPVNGAMPGSVTLEVHGQSASSFKAPAIKLIQVTTL